MKQEPILMTQLEEQLKTDTTGQYRQTILGQLYSRKSDVEQQLSRGCRPADYQRLTGEKVALDSAERIIQQVVESV